MRKVIDTSALNTDELQTFFLDPANTAVVTDLTVAEALKHKGLSGDELALFRMGFKIIAENAHRVIVLRPTAELAKTRPSKDSTYESLIDAEATKSFPVFAAEVMSGVESEVTRHIERNQLRGREFFRQFTDKEGPELVRAITTAQAAKLPHEMLKKLRSEGPLGDNFYMHALEVILADMRAVVDAAFPNSTLTAEDLFPWIRFRFRIAMFALSTFWIRKGGHLTRKTENLRNDAIDMFCVAYGTLFDGVITKDTALRDISNLATDILRHSFWINRPPILANVVKNL